MKLALKDFQEHAVDEIAAKLRHAQSGVHLGPQALVFSAPTGSGKTLMATAMIERILVGDDTAVPDPDATFLWITDLPELNEQTMDKMLATSTVLNAFNLEVIDSSFDRPRLDDGRVYFLNTQKLGKDKLLTQRGDGRTYTIWETISATIDAKGGSFVVVIDEAQRGMRTRAEDRDAVTIIQRFLRGFEAMPAAKVVVGISATPKRFEDLLEGTDHTKHSVKVEAAEVRASGLLKDRMILHHLADDQAADMTLLQEAAREWLGFRQRWFEYAETESVEPVEPILVVQVADAAGNRITATPLEGAISAIEAALPEPLPVDAYAHAFDSGVTLEVGSRAIRYLKPSQISRDRDVRVVFFKTALSTGWDCPQAEVMMSFRKAVDATFIAQLIGRMVRTPLARRIERDETLNTVALFLPHYDAEGVALVVKTLQDPEHEYVPPIIVTPGANTQVLEPADGTGAIFEALAKIPCYLVPSLRRAKQTIRLMKLARALKRDGIADVHDEAKEQLVSHLVGELEARRGAEEFQQLREDRARITIGALEYDPGTGDLIDRGKREVEASPKNIDDLFAEAGRRVGEGLHKALWEQLTDGVNDLGEIRTAKVEAAVLFAEAEVVTGLEALAETVTTELLKEHLDTIDTLSEERQGLYRDLRGLAREPTLDRMRSRDRIVVGKPEGAKSYPKHIYVDSEGQFHGKFNTWEEAVLDEELAREDVIGWLRNVDRKDWALQVPYRDTTRAVRPMYPEFLIFRGSDKNVVVDILDPHDPTRSDAVPKAKGLSEYAEKHGLRLDRIEMIMMEGDELRRLDLNVKKVREAARVVDSSEALVHLYRRE